MQIETEVTNGKLRIGGAITPEIENVLSNCPTPTDIFDHMDAFSAEIQESHTNQLVGSEAEAKRQAELTIIEAREKLGLLQKPAPAKKEYIKRDLNPKKQAPKSNKVETKRVEPVVQTTSQVKEHMSTLDDELNELETKAEQETSEVEATPKQKIIEALAKIKDAPTEVQINRWKQELGQDAVHVTVFSEKELYIYKHLTRAQWQKVQELIVKIQENKKNVSEDELKEKVVMHCMLWPKLELEWKYNSRAGVLDALYQAIMQSSYFLSPEVVAALTVEL